MTKLYDATKRNPLCRKITVQEALAAADLSIIAVAKQPNYFQRTLFFYA